MKEIKSYVFKSGYELASYSNYRRRLADKKRVEASILVREAEIIYAEIDALESVLIESPPESTK